MTVIPETLCEHQICYLRFYWRCYRDNQEPWIGKWTESTMAKRKRTNNDLQNITHKTRNWETQTQQINGGEHMWFMFH